VLEKAAAPGEKLCCLAPSNLRKKTTRTKYTLIKEKHPKMFLIR